jgi:molecular chaperone Hsp33
MGDRIINAISGDGKVYLRVMDSRETVETARKYHNTTPTATALLGRVLTAAALLGCELKGEKDSLTLRIRGDGPAGTVLAVSDSIGNPRGYVENPQVDLPLNDLGKLNVGGAVGKGSLIIIKDLGLKEPYIGQVPLVSGEIAEDITSYLYQSEQTPGVCALGVLVGRDYTVSAAGGFVLSLMPGADESVISRVENDLKDVPAVTAMLSGGMSCEEIARLILKGSFGGVMRSRDVGYRCYCSEERTRAALVSLGASELKKLESELSQIEVTCHFCDRVYHFNPSVLVSEAEALGSGESIKKQKK